MIFGLPQQKQISVEDKLSQLISDNKISIKKFTKYIGLIVSICSVISYGWFFVKNFEYVKYRILKRCYEN